MARMTEAELAEIRKTIEVFWFRRPLKLEAITDMLEKP